MNKQIAYIVSGILLICLAGITVYSVAMSSKTTIQSEYTVAVSATIEPIAMIAREIMGDFGTVHTILAAGSSPHTFEPTPQDIKKIADSTIIFAIGQGLDMWVTDVATAANNTPIKIVDTGIQFKTYDAHDHEHSHSEELHDEHGENEDPADDTMHHDDTHESDETLSNDPHYWLDPRNAKIIAGTIRDELTKLDPTNSSAYSENYDAFITALEAAEVEWKRSLEPVTNAQIITFHDAWAYFSDFAEMSVVATVEPFPGQQPTPQYLAALQDTMMSGNIDAVFTEPQLASDAIAAFITDTGIAYGILDPLGNSTMSYIALISKNIDTLVQVIQ